MKVCIPLLLITFLIALIVMPFAQASPGLNVTVTTDKPYYIPEESVNVNGTLTQNGVSVEDGLVALQVDDPYNTAVAVRTQQTGTTSTVGPIEIVEAFPCDPGTGFPKDSFQIKEFLGVNVVVNNTDSEPHYILVVVNAYDASGVTLGIGAGGGTILPGTQSSVTPGLSIPITAYTGNATAYASVYTDWPKNGGVPYCPEVSASYEIVETGGLGVQGSAGPEAQNPTPGTYNITFKLSTNHKEGTYTAYATSSYGGENATASTTLNFEAGGDVAVTYVVPVKPCSRVPGAVHPMDYAFPTWGVPLNITVTVENKDAAATFDVDVYYVNATGSYLIGTQTKTLGGSATANVTVSWYVSAVDLGVYNITAEAVLEGDTNTTDNSLTYSRVKIKLPGDANGDAWVKLGDFATLGASWYKACEDVGYEPTADFTGDCFIKLGDFATLGANWYKSTDAYTADD